MTALARRNGWRGFDTAGGVQRVERGGFGRPPARGGWLYRCDGMPTMMGCGAEVVVPRKWTRVGLKKSGWLVSYGLCFPDETADDEKGHDLDVVLVFCPRCTETIRRRDEAST